MILPDDTLHNKQDNKSPRLGIFGGTFNPIHIGHLRLAEDVREDFFLDKIIFIPTNIPPHKRLEGNIKASNRLDMIKLSIRGNVFFDIDDIEIKKGGLSFTIDTINYIYKNYDFLKRPFFILGSDQAYAINSWKEINKLAKLISFIVLIRKAESGKILEIKEKMKTLGLESFFFKRRELDVTSSEIRNKIQNHKSIRYLVKNEVLDYIFKNKLY